MFCAASNFILYLLPNLIKVVLAFKDSKINYSNDCCWFGALEDAMILLWKGIENKTKFLFKMHFGV